jgi:hypothetical protein
MTTQEAHDLLSRLNPTVYHDGKCSLRYNEVSDDQDWTNEVKRLVAILTGYDAE